MNRLALQGGLGLLLCILVYSFCGMIWMDCDPYKQNLVATISPPFSDYWLGSDYLGRSVYSRLAGGARYSLTIAGITVTVSCLLGAFLGIIAGYYGKVVDMAIMRLTDLTLAFPGILFAIVLLGLLGGSIFTLVLALSASMWCDYCRLARNITRSVKNSMHMQAGVLLGFSTAYLIRAYIFPTVLPQLGTLASLNMGRTILNIAGLGFLGIGLKPPLPEWGGMINEGISYIGEAPWLIIAPGAMIFITVLSFQLLAGCLSNGRR